MFHTPPLNQLKRWEQESIIYSYRPETQEMPVVTAQEEPKDTQEENAIPAAPEADKTHLEPENDVSKSTSASPETAVSPEAFPDHVAASDNTFPGPVDTDVAAEKWKMDQLTLKDLPQDISLSIDQFMGSLTEPKYQTPLKPANVSVMFQNFYKVQSRVIVASIQENISKTYTSLPEGDYRKTSKVILLKTAEELRYANLLRTNQELFTYQLIKYWELSERYLFGGIYNRIFKFQNHSESEVEFNASLNDKLELLRDLCIPFVKLLDIGKSDASANQCFRNDELLLLYYFKDSLHELANLNQVFTPREKLLTILKTHNLIIKNLNEINSAVQTEDKPFHVSNDYILPALMYLCINSSVDDIYLNFLYIKRFFNEQDLHGELNYSLTNFEAIVMYLSKLTAQELDLENEGKVLGDPLLNVPLPYEDIFVRVNETAPTVRVTAAPSVNNFKTFLKANRSRSNSTKSVTSAPPVTETAGGLFYNALPSAPSFLPSDLHSLTDPGAIRNLGSALDSSFKGILGRFNRASSGPQPPATLNATRRSNSNSALSSIGSNDQVPLVDDGSIMELIEVEQTGYFDSPSAVSLSSSFNPIGKFNDVLVKFNGMQNIRSSDSLRSLNEDPFIPPTSPIKQKKSRSRAASLIDKFGQSMLNLHSTSISAVILHNSSDSLSTSSSNPLKEVFPVPIQTIAEAKSESRAEISRTTKLPKATGKYATGGKAKNFEDLSINELKDMFMKYNQLVAHVASNDGFEDS
ncbi:hypothetical protein BABINDRAFT_163776 [Babjeviella inositovora NRRL Y-12698]|uniref:VPS9 domain-containing protein n=1 Tax=Babjeviella inositovora NRRL Y-12698 TaxID=984486 RepID=A0A1E3QH52_9ASCO|nr:uncharacterized protein BABINDRAFT_163776 [Babjeviella inositovora NRRL Y-12698]ODQ77043.1 hypothetical protein BABINDRAFT_163776 [Babjeviella inositovora NRRL Y-12698]